MGKGMGMEIGDGHEDGDGFGAWYRVADGDGNRWGMGMYRPGAGNWAGDGTQKGGCGPWGEPSSCWTSHTAQATPSPGCPPRPSPAVTLGALPSPAAPPYTG